LLKLKEEFKDKEKKIDLINTDANSWIIDRCNNYKWQNNRAVLFLDPYGMQVNWETIKAIANTEAIDLWYLFPFGIGVNRLLKKDRLFIAKPKRQRCLVVKLKQLKTLILIR